MKQLKPNPGSHLERQWSMVLVIRRLVLLLGLLETITDLGDELVSGAQLVIDGWHARDTTSVGQHDRRGRACRRHETETCATSSRMPSCSKTRPRGATEPNGEDNPR
jgi:hypothetical protein